MTDDDFQEVDIAKDEINVQLRAHDRKKGYGKDCWPLANFSGGIEEIKIRRRGKVTTISIKSPDATIWCEDVHRPPQPKAQPTNSGRPTP